MYIYKKESTKEGTLNTGVLYSVLLERKIHHLRRVRSTGLICPVLPHRRNGQLGSVKSASEGQKTEVFRGVSMSTEETLFGVSRLFQWQQDNIYNLVSTANKNGNTLGSSVKRV